MGVLLKYLTQYMFDNSDNYTRLARRIKLLENQICCLSNSSSVKSIIINGNGGAIYSIPPNSNLILLATDGMIRYSPQDYSYATSTGIITFTSTIDPSSLIQEIYQ